MKESYFDVVVMIERLHRLFLEVVKGELDRQDKQDITNVQALILYNIGKNNQLTVGELTNRGYYLGSNVSYNLRKMVKNGYVNQVPSAHDRRSSHVRLSPKGMDLYAKLDSAFAKQTILYKEKLADMVDLDVFGKTLRAFENFWSSIIDR
jgi:DNA-binding MarR family transcriptional regulator